MNNSDPQCALHYAFNTRVAPRVAGGKDTLDPAAITRAANTSPLVFASGPGWVEAKASSLATYYNKPKTNIWRTILIQYNPII